MLGKGKYDLEHDIVHKMSGAASSILIVIKGKHGDGLSCKMTEEHLRYLPKILKLVADEIRPELDDDMKQIEEINKGESDAKSTTEDSGPQSFSN